jgi:glycosyltransferase involved in cell wall biosynthesis
MHIAINAQLFSTGASYRAAGVSSYSWGLLRSLGGLAQSEPDLQVTAFVHTPNMAAPGVRLELTALPLDKPALRVVWEQLALPQAVARIEANLLHGLVNVLPLASRIPGVVTVHDLSFLRMPEKFPAHKRWYLTLLCRASVAKAAHVIAVSGQTADDLMRFFQTPARKITVIPNGVDPRFRPGDAEQSRQFRAAKGLPERFLLYLGTLEPRKNLPQLLDAYANWQGRAVGGTQVVKLVIAGAKGWFYEEIFRRAEVLGITHHVHFPGFVADEELPDWYRAAEGFVYPSLLEGFGLPVLEAMACGTPVLCSATPSLLEVAGNATLTAPPLDVEAWAAGLALLTGQPALRAELQRRGVARAAHYGWPKTAAATVEVYKMVAGSAGQR